MTSATSAEVELAGERRRCARSKNAGSGINPFRPSSEAGPLTSLGAILGVCQ